MPQGSVAIAPPLPAPEALVSAEERTLGMLIHLLALFTGFIGVLILWLVKKDESRFVDHHGREAFNFMLSQLIYYICLISIMMVIGVVTLGLGFFILLPVIFVFIIGTIILGIMACVAANKGVWHRYPLTIRFISD